MKRRISLLSIMIALALLIGGLYPLYSLAAGDAKVMQAIANENTVKAFVRGVTSADGATYQIANVPSEEPKGYKISDDATKMRTLIMVDNSLSIPNNSRPLVKEAMKAIIDAHAENETFRLATFSDSIGYLSDQYSSDYTALKNVVDSIENLDQETYLTDVLYDVIDELNDENYMGYTRIVVFSDGVDNKPIGVTREELNKKLDETPYPVYTVGSKTGKNDSELENMFALSRLTGCEYIILEDTDASAIAEVTRKDNDITVFEASIPEDAMVGGRQSSKLTLSDGTSLVFNVNMPFSVKEKEAEPDIIPVPESEQEQTTEPASESESVQEPEPSGIPMSMLIAGAGIFVLLILIVLLIVFLTKKKQPKQQPAPVQPVQTEYEKTVLVGATPNRKESGTVHMTPDGMGAELKRYRFTLTDAADSARSFRCELISEIKVGRQPDNNIVLSDDTTVHGHQATVSVTNDTFYYTDLKDVKNHSSVNGVQLKPGLPQLIVNNSKITIGRHTYVVSVSK